MFGEEAQEPEYETGKGRIIPFTEVKYLNKLLNESYKGKANTNANIDDRYILDNELSTDKTKVYIDKNTNDIAMVNRGTSDFKDVMTDAKLLFGYNDKRFNEPK